jgi:nicotinamidase-related amidase
LEAKFTALIIVDMQNDFVRSHGKLYVGRLAEKSIPAIANLIRKAREKTVPVVYTKDWHSRGDPEFKLWGEHCLAGSEGAKIVNELAPKEGDITIKKATYDPWFKTNLEEILVNRVVRSLVVTGTVSNICVLHTAAGGAIRGFNIVLPLDCVSPLEAYREIDQALAIRQISSVYLGKVTTSNRVKFTNPRKP